MYLTIIMVLGLAAFWQSMEGVKPIGWLLALVTIAAVYWCMAGFSFSGGKTLLGLDQEGAILMGVAILAMLGLTAMLGGQRFAGPPTGDAIKKRAAEIAAREARAGARA